MIWAKCSICNARDSVRTLGTIPYCFQCAESFLAPLRHQYKPMDLMHAVIDRELDESEHKEFDFDIKMFHMHCVTCQARWIGDGYTNCKWCAERDARKREYEAKDVLFPSDDELYDD
jgi:hypothetical protein